MGRDQSATAAQLPENRGKSRYVNILPCKYATQNAKVLSTIYPTIYSMASDVESDTNGCPIEEIILSKNMCMKITCAKSREYKL